MGDRRTARSVVALLALTLLASASSTYTVGPGDTLLAIAARQGVSVTDLAEANGITQPDRILVGDVLVIPGGDGAAATADGAASTGGAHVIAAGETLGTIAARYGMTVAELAAANGISDPDRIIAGTTLQVSDLPAAPTPAAPPAGDAAPAAPAPGGAGTHVVSSGETLSGIANRYGTSLADLVAANDLSDANLIRVGQTLQIPGAGWRCPVAGEVTFVDDYGYVKPSGRTHEGIDLFAPRGTPVLAPISGVAEQVEGTLGGLQVWFHGDDGVLYISTHLDALGTAGRVGAGTEVGTVGTSGNAANTSPHVHFEVLVDGENTNPYPLLADACR